MEKSSPLSGNAALVILVLVNLIPLVGVLAWDWDVFEIVVLYWFENVVIGLVCILKILTATGPDETKSVLKNREDPSMPEHLRTPEIVERTAPSLGVKLFLAAFFIFHYGMFCFAHGLFIFMLLDGQVGGFIQGGPLALFARKLPEAFASGGIWFALALIASHLYSYFHNYLGKGECHRTSAQAQWAGPYGRIIVLHVAILFGAIVISALGSPVFLLILLILGKIGMDLKLHLRSQKGALPSGGVSAVERNKSSLPR
ncbi:MAG: DUF6498-containing protein [Luteolibacter sp.]